MELEPVMLPMALSALASERIASTDAKVSGSDVPSATTVIAVTCPPLVSPTSPGARWACSPGTAACTQRSTRSPCSPHAWQETLKSKERERREEERLDLVVEADEAAEDAGEVVDEHGDHANQAQPRPEARPSPEVLPHRTHTHARTPLAQARQTRRLAPNRRRARLCKLEGGARSKWNRRTGHLGRGDAGGKDLPEERDHVQPQPPPARLLVPHILPDRKRVPELPRSEARLPVRQRRGRRTLSCG
eukprot:1788479-Rhodomonas_salina.1